MIDDLQWEVNSQNQWYQLLYTDFSSLTFSGVYIIWGIEQFNTSPRIIKIGQSTDLSNRLTQYKHEKGKGTVFNYQFFFDSIYVTWASLQESYLDGVERYLGNLYHPLISERFPDAAPIAVNSPF